MSRTTFANLFAVIGTRYGAGNGSTTFNLPDTRGLFIRSLDRARGIDPARALGSRQTATHITGDDGNDADRAVHSFGNIADAMGDQPDGVARKIYFHENQGDTVKITTTPAYQRAVRPENIALNHIIKL